MSTSRDRTPDAAQAAEAAARLGFDPSAFRWDGVPARDYKYAEGDRRGMGWRGVQRFTLSDPGRPAAAFHLRYFELAPGGYSSLEQHAHVHLIVVLRGRGKALVGRRVVDLAAHDVVYVPPETPHRWINDGDVPFGFLCPVDADRDRPRPIGDDEWAALSQDPQTAPYVF